MLKRICIVRVCYFFSKIVSMVLTQNTIVIIWFFFFAEIAADWSDHALWWPDKNQWLLRSRSTLDQYDVQANAKLLFTPMHKNVRLQLPDLQILDMRMNFSSKVFSAITSLCKELGRNCTSFDLQCLQHVTVISLHTEHAYSSTISHK